MSGELASVTEITEAGPTGIYEALPEALGMIGGIPKDEENREQHFSFRSIEKILETAKPVFAELGISVVPIGLSNVEYEEIIAKSGARGWRCTLQAFYRFGHSDGSAIIAEAAGEAIDYGDKSTTKAQQIAFKYALTQTLMIASGDADNDGESAGEIIPAEEILERTTNALKVKALAIVGGSEGDAANLWGGVVELFGEHPPLESHDEAIAYMTETWAQAAEEAEPNGENTQ